MQAGDLNVEASLDRLERLLSSWQTSRKQLSEADLNRLRQEMNTDGLLFDIRVLRSRIHSQELGRRALPKQRKGFPSK